MSHPRYSVDEIPDLENQKVLSSEESKSDATYVASMGIDPQSAFR